MAGPGDILRRIFDPTGVLPGLAPPLFGGGGAETPRLNLPAHLRGMPPSGLDPKNRLIGDPRSGGFQPTGEEAAPGTAAESLVDYYQSMGLGVFISDAPGGGSRIDVDEVGTYFADANGNIIDAPGGGGSGGSSRFLFPEEQQALQLQNERDRRILAGELNWQEVRPGFWQDSITGATYDDNDLELARQKVEQDASQFDRSFDEQVRQFGVNFNENQRQFDTTIAEDQRQFNVSEERNRARLNLESELGRRGAALNEADFVRKVLSNPSDFLFRAALTRGQGSSVPRITPEAILGQFGADIRGAQEPVISTAVATQPRMQLPPELLPNTPSVAPAATPLAGLNARLRSGEIDAGTAIRLARGEKFAAGTDGTKARRMVVGDPREPGMPNPEMVEVMEPGPKTRLRITPMYANGTNSGPERNAAGFQSGTLAGGGYYYRNPSGGAGTFGNVNPEGQFQFLRMFSGLDPEKASSISGFTPQTAGAIDYDPLYDSPGSPGSINYGDLAVSSAPPAVRDIISGRNPRFLQLPFATPTASALGNLTEDELAALNTAVAAKYGISAQDVIDASRQRFSAPRSRRSARLVL